MCMCAGGVDQRCEGRALGHRCILGEITYSNDKPRPELLCVKCGSFPCYIHLSLTYSAH